MGVVRGQMVRAYNLLWGGHRISGKVFKWLIINGIGVIDYCSLRPAPTARFRASFGTPSPPYQLLWSAGPA